MTKNNFPPPENLESQKKLKTYNSSQPTAEKKTVLENPEVKSAKDAPFDIPGAESSAAPKTTGAKQNPPSKSRPAGKPPAKKKTPKKKPVKKPGVAKRNKSKSGSRKERSDGIAENVEIVQAALREIQPPKHVRFRPRDWPFWDSVIAEFPKVEWTDHTLEVAALLTRAMSGFEMEEERMWREGAVLEKKQIIPAPTAEDPDHVEIVVVGTYVNPRKQVIDMHSRNVLAYRRSLSLQARVKTGEPRDRAKTRAAALEKEKKITGIDEDRLNLIAFPNKKDD